MTDNEQRAHDIAVAFTSLVQKANFEASVHNAVSDTQKGSSISVSINDFMANYIVTYNSVLNYLNDQ